MSIFLVLIILANFLLALVDNILAIMILDSITLPIVLWIEINRD